MKPSSIFKLTIFLVLSFFANASFSQITTTGMAIQGIARDASNNAITNTSIGLKFTLHYTNLSNSNVDLSPITVSLTTDAFGVFSYVLDMSSVETSLFFDYQMKLKIEQTSPSSTLISDENLNFAPYAVAASNGVPTGTIMPYVGTVAPRGWQLCDGSSIPVIPQTQTIRTLLGSSNTPDLRGIFLRGAGTNGNNAYSSNVGPALKAIQTDGIESHSLTVTDPGHNHAITDPGHRHTWGHGLEGDDSGGGGSYNEFTQIPGSHTTVIGVSTTGITVNNNTTGITVNYSGQTETRPINYGVTYIIKL